jgi:hydroxymethylbilane synthase
VKRPFFRLGTRGSPLAMAQAHEVARLFAHIHQCPLEDIAIHPFLTRGDRIQDRSLMESGGKGLFTKELDLALLHGEIDVAVHSAKDLPTQLPADISLIGYLLREDARDAFISPHAASVMDLAQGATFGSASLRRQAQILRLRPDLQPVLLRGNVETRLRKIEAGVAQATFLALAGLKRLGMLAHVTAVLEMDQFLPAIGQGAIGMAIRGNDKRAVKLLEPLCDMPTGWALTLERAFLRLLDGSCRTPIAGHAQIEGETLVFRGMILKPDGSQAWEVTLEGAVGDAEQMGVEAGRRLLEAHR